MKKNGFLKLSPSNETDIKFINVDKNCVGNTYVYPDVPYRSECKNISNCINFSKSDKTDLKFNMVKSTTECNELVIYPTISYLKSEANIEKLQENNNYYISYGRERTSHVIDYAKKYKGCEHTQLHENKQEIFLSQWDQSISHVGINLSVTKLGTIGKNIPKIEIKSGLCNKQFFAPQFYRAETILNEDLQKQIVSSNMENKVTSIPICKPPLSPYTGTIHRNQRFTNSKKELLKNKSDANNNHSTDEYSKMKNSINCQMDSDDGEFCTKENEEDESDYCDKAEEMELLDNLDSENILDDSTENVDGTVEEYDSASEEMLEEVHRLFHSTSVNDFKSPFINSLFPNTPPFIRFVREGESVEQLPPQYRSKLKWKLSSVTPNVVKRAAKRSGFRLINRGSHWTGYFGKHMKLIGFKSILEHQKFNHLPGSFQIGRKDRLWRNVSLLASKNGKGKEFNFLPKTYCLPGDLRSLKQVWDDEDIARKAKWILKPPASARGIGVKVINKWSQIPKKRPAIVQNYISRPFLIDGSKFDLRIYVAVTSCDPLRIYVYKDGLARFASQKYSKSSKNISNRFIHLTNYSVNKKNENYTSNENHEKCQGHKWSLTALWKYMEDVLHIDWKPIWKNIKDCIVKTIISVESSINSNVKMYCSQKNCVYELFGFDVLLDSKLKPWVIEVNVSPSLHSNSPLDIEVKSGMVADLFNLIGFQFFCTPEDTSVVALPQNRRPSLSASSIPNCIGNLDRSYFKSAQRQASLISLNKSTKKMLSCKESAKLTEKGELKEFEKTDSLPNLQIRADTPNSNNSSKSVHLNRKKVSTLSFSNADSTSQISQEPIDQSLCQRSGYYFRSLTPNEKLKHIFYIQKGICENMSVLTTITDKLTVDDSRILMESLDEFNRAGDFELTFPTGDEESDNYLTYINNYSGCRYYNLLLQEFLKKFRVRDKSKRRMTDSVYNLITPEGIKLLEKYTKNLKDVENELWTNPSLKDLTRIKSKLRSSSAGTISIS